MISARSTAHLAGAVASLLAVLAAGCDDSPFGGISDTISAEIVTPDTTLFLDDNATFVAEAVYGIGPGAPATIRWAVSDTAKLAVFTLTDLTGSVTAKDTGAAWVIALINEEFLDSARIDVVAPGLLRWRAPVAGGLGRYAAVGFTDSLVRVSGVGTTLAAFDLTGAAGPSAPGTCNGVFGPSVGDANTVYLTGDGCSRRHSPDLGVSWSSSIGDLDGSVAVAADGDAVVLHSEGTSGSGGAAIVSRLAASTGAEEWRDTLVAQPIEQRSSLAIASNGDIYVAWRGTGDAGWLTRITQTGDTLWNVLLPAWPRLTGPALTATRVLVSYRGGIAVYDTAGGSALWSRQFDQDDPGATPDVQASPPVLDRSGNIYVQTVRALHSYTADGTPRWTADSLGGGSPADGVGAPTVLVDTTVVITRGGDRVCGINGNTGVPRWCSGSLTGAGDVIGGAAVGADRTIFVTRTAGELIALWNDVAADPAAWTTEGGNHRRTRRR